MDQAAPFFGIDVPLMRLIGLQAEHLDEHIARTRLPRRPEILNSRGDIHGGTLMSALDFTLSAAARAHDPLGTGVITIDMTTHFLSPAQGDVRIEARTIRRGKRIAFCEGTVIDETGTEVCMARAAFKLIPRGEKG